MGAGLFMGSTPINGVQVGTFSKGGIIPSGTISITNNGNYDVTQYANANVNVSGTGIDTSDATLTSGGQMLEGIIAYGKNGKVEGTIPSKGVASITPSETAQEIAAGQYLSGKQTIKAIPNTYVGSGVTRQDAKTITPSESIQVAVDAGIYTDGAIQVNAIPSNYVGSAVTRQAAKTIMPSTSEQTAVQTGVYTTGTIKIAAIQTETKDITSNGTYTPTSGKFFSSVNVNVSSVEFSTQSKSIIPNETEQIITPDSGYDGLSSVTVGAISSTYVGSGVTKQAAKTVAPSTSEQTIVSAGVYTTGDIKVSAMPTGTLNNPVVDSTGLVTAQVGTSGYLAGGTKKTLQLTVQTAKTVTPSESEQIAVEAGVYTTGQIKVAAAPAGLDTSDATATDSDIVKDKTAYVKGKKVTGLIDEIDRSTKIYYGDSQIENIQKTTQIDGFEIIIKNNIALLFRVNSRIGLLVSGDRFGNATAENVAVGSTFTSAAGVKVAGTMVVQKYYTGTSTPSSSLGNDGDLYFKE